MNAPASRVTASGDVIASVTCDVHQFGAVNAVVLLAIRAACESDDGARRSDLLTGVVVILEWQRTAMGNTASQLDEHWLTAVNVEKGGAR